VKPGDVDDGNADKLFIVGIYIKFGYKNPSILAPCDLVDVSTLAE
jgi:hypothetical protein